MSQNHQATDIQRSYVEHDGVDFSEGKQIGNSTVKVIMEFEVPSNSRSRIGGIGIIQSLWMEVNVESRKQCVELESTRVGMIIFGTEVEVRWSVKEFGLERADALRRSSAVAPTRSTQPWSSAGAQGLLPIFLAPWQRSCFLEFSPRTRCEP